MKNYVIFFLFCLLSLASLQAQDASALSEQERPAAENAEAQETQMNNFKLSEEVKMYPNPVQHYLNIQSSFPITRVRVYSLLGQLVKDVPNRTDRIYLGDLNSGIYMIKIHSNDLFVTKKLVVK